MIFQHGLHGGFLVVLRSHADHVRRHQGHAVFLWIGQNQGANGDGAEQMIFRVDHIAGVDGFLVHARRANLCNGLRRGHLRTQGHEFRRHHGTGGIVGIFQKFVNLLAGVRIGL